MGVNLLGIGAQHIPLRQRLELSYDWDSSRFAGSLPRFLGSSMAEHPAVNRRVAGSSPARGATHFDFVSVRGPRPVLSGIASRLRLAANGIESSPRSHFFVVVSPALG